MTETVAARARDDAPEPQRGSRLPDIPGPLDTFGAFWRWLRRMSTALVLLFAMTVATVLATFVPQEPLVPQTVAQWREGAAGPGPAIAAALDWVSLFDVFGSWWFLALTALLFTSLTACLIPRWRAFARVVRRQPPAGRNLERLRHHVAFTTVLPPEEALEHAERVLRARRFRRRRVPASATGSGAVQIAAERGHAREGGSLLFHTAFYLLLAGAVIGQVFGFTGQINVPEGQAFADTRLAYDAARPGRWFGLDDHRAFVVTLDDFDVTYFDNFVPREYTSRITVSENGIPVREGVVRVNHPFVHRGMKLFQARFGMAPRVVVRVGDQVRFDEAIMLAPIRGTNLWSGTAKLFVADPEHQLALDLVLAPDAQMQDGKPVIGPSPEPRNPVLVAELYFGKLGLERPVPASQFDRSAGAAGAPAMLRPGRSASMAGGEVTVEFVDLGYWSGFQVTHAPGRWLLLAAAVLVLVGLLPSLHSYRRRVWVEARAADGGSTVVLAGVALQRKPVFADEFERLSTSLRRTLQEGS